MDIKKNKMKGMSNMYIFLFILSIIFLAISIYGNIQRRKHEKNDNKDTIQQYTNTKNSVSSIEPYIDRRVISSTETYDGTFSSKTELTVSTKTYNYIELQPHPLLKQAYFYKVKGKNTKTNRLKTYEIYAYDETDSIRRAKLLGLTEPFTVLYSEQNEPTEKQLDAAEASQIIIPANATKLDVSNIFHQLWDELTPVTNRTVEYVLANDIVISPYSTESSAQYMIEQIQKMDKP